MTPIGTKRRWHNAPVVREPDRAGLKRLAFLLVCMAAAVTPFTLYLVQQMEYVRVRYEIEELRVRHDRLVEAEQRLRIERARLTSPARVERCALRELGLVHPPASRVVVMSTPAPGAGGLMARAPDQP